MAFNEQGIVGESLNLTDTFDTIRTHVQNQLEQVPQYAEQGRQRLINEANNFKQFWEQTKQSLCPQGLTQCGKDAVNSVTDQRIFSNGSASNKCIRNKEFLSILLSALLCLSLSLFQ